MAEEDDATKVKQEPMSSEEKDQHTTMTNEEGSRTLVAGEVIGSKEEQDDDEQKIGLEHPAKPALVTVNTTAEELPEPSRVKRERKSIQSFNPNAYETQKKEIEIPAGCGVKLMDMPNVVDNFKAITWSDPHLKMLHSLIFGGKGKKKEFKGHLLQFNGLVYPDGQDLEEERTKVKEKMYKIKLPDLVEILDLVDVPRSGVSFGLEKTKVPSKEEYCTRLLEWLEKPMISGKERKPPSSSSSTKKRRKPSSSLSTSTTKAITPGKKTKKDSVSSQRTSTKNNDKKPKKSPAPSSSSDEININIPGVNVDKLREKVRSIVNTGDRDTLSVKSIRSMLEEWLDTDLEDHKDAIRKIVMDEL